MDEKMKCEVVQDLLPLYVDGACTEGSRALVEEHVTTCPGCKKLLKEMGAPLEAVLPEPKDEAGRTESEELVAMALKKMHLNAKRVIALCLAVLLAIPVGVIGLREMSGSGLCLSNYAEYQQVQEAVTAWLKEGSGAAVDEMEPVWIYNSVRELRPDHAIFSTYHIPEAYDGDFSQGKFSAVTLLGETFYFPGEAPWEGDFHGTQYELDQKQLYEAGDELGLLHSLVKNNSLIVPEALFYLVAETYDDVDAENYCPVELDGQTYYIYVGYYGTYPAAVGSDVETLLNGHIAREQEKMDFEPELYAMLPELESPSAEYCLARYYGGMPEAWYQLFTQGYAEIYQNYQAYNAYYEQLGYQGFCDLWRAEMKELLAELEGLGLTASDERFLSINVVRDQLGQKYYSVLWRLNMGEYLVQIDFEARDYGEDAEGPVCVPTQFTCYNAPEEVQEIIAQLNALCVQEIYEYEFATHTLWPDSWPIYE